MLGIAAPCGYLYYCKYPSEKKSGKDRRIIKDELPTVSYSI